MKNRNMNFIMRYSNSEFELLHSRTYNIVLLKVKKTNQIYSMNDLGTKLGYTHFDKYLMDNPEKAPRLVDSIDTWYSESMN